MEIRTCDAYCAGCIYGGGNNEHVKACSYLLVTGQRRPCPAGKGCTVRILRKKTQKESFRESETAGKVFRQYSTSR